MIDKDPRIIMPYGEVLFTAEVVQARIEQMATDCIVKYRDENPLFICLLHGGLPFSSKLMFAITEQDPNFQPEMDTMIVSTYGDEQVPDQFRIVTDLAPKTQVQDRVAVLLDDISHTGLTTAGTKSHILNKSAKRVDSIVLIQRETTLEYPAADMYGFKVSTEKWLTGMGLDDAKKGREYNRWMGSVAVATTQMTH